MLQDCQSVRIYASEQCPRQDSNLRSRLRRGLLCTPLTRRNEFPHTMIGGVSGAAYRTWLAGTPSTGSGHRPGSDGRPGSTPAASAPRRAGAGRGRGVCVRPDRRRAAPTRGPGPGQHRVGGPDRPRSAARARCPVTRRPPAACPARWLQVGVFRSGDVTSHDRQSSDLYEIAAEPAFTGRLTLPNVPRLS
jgi:hypothetical protein